jgi:hypothetical protein
MDPGMRVVLALLGVLIGAALSSSSIVLGAALGGFIGFSIAEFSLLHATIAKLQQEVAQLRRRASEARDRELPAESAPKPAYPAAADPAPPMPAKPAAPPQAPKAVPAAELSRPIPPPTRQPPPRPSPPRPPAPDLPLDRGDQAFLHRRQHAGAGRRRRAVLSAWHFCCAISPSIRMSPSKCA